MTQQEKPHLIIDNGSYSIKAGTEEAVKPTVAIPSLVGKMDNNNYLFSKDIYSKSSKLNLLKPISGGIVSNKEAFNKIYEYLFKNELKINPEEHGVFITESWTTQERNREELAKIMFEDFKVPKLFVGTQQVCSLYARGQSTGLVLDIGADNSYAVPIDDCIAVKDNVVSNTIGGSTVDVKFQQLLSNTLKDKNIDWKNLANVKALIDYKEKNSYVAQDPIKEIKNYENKNTEKLTLPDGQVLDISVEKYQCTEVLFKPCSGHAIHQLAHLAASKCDTNLSAKLYQNVILTGGTSLLRGLQQRLNMEMAPLVTKNTKLNITATDEREYMAWLGANVVCSNEGFKNMWVTKKDYEEQGASVINRCFGVAMLKQNVTIDDQTKH